LWTEVVSAERAVELGAPANLSSILKSPPGERVLAICFEKYEDIISEEVQEAAGSH